MGYVVALDYLPAFASSQLYRPNKRTDTFHDLSFFPLLLFYDSLFFCSIRNSGLEIWWVKQSSDCLPNVGTQELIKRTMANMSGIDLSLP